MTLPAAGSLGLPEGSVVAVPSYGELTVYRLIAKEAPEERDFRCMSVEAARRRPGIPELLRAGLSHWLTPEQALLSRRRASSRIAAVTLPPAAHVARTGRQQGHVTVWADPRDLVAHARALA